MAEKQRPPIDDVDHLLTDQEAKVAAARGLVGPASPEFEIRFNAPDTVDEETGETLRSIEAAMVEETEKRAREAGTNLCIEDPVTEDLRRLQ